MQLLRPRPKLKDKICRGDNFYQSFAEMSACLGCCTWGCNKWGLKGRLPSLPGNRPNLPFLRPLYAFFAGGPKQHLEFQKTDEKCLFPQTSSDLLNPPSLRPPFAALQLVSDKISPEFSACKGNRSIYLHRSGPRKWPSQVRELLW